MREPERADTVGIDHRGTGDTGSPGGPGTVAASPTGTVAGTQPVGMTRPPEEEIVYGRTDEVAGTRRRRFDIPATLGGALAALGALLLLSSLVGTAIGTIGYQYDVRDRDLSVGGLIGGLMVLVVACLIGGWVAGRMAWRRGGIHGLVAILWLIVLAAVLAALAAIFGSNADIRGSVGLPSWFSADTHRVAAIATGVVAAVLMLLAGFLGGLLGGRKHASESVDLVSVRRGVRSRAGGIRAGRAGSENVGAEGTR